MLFKQESEESSQECHTMILSLPNILCGVTRKRKAEVLAVVGTWAFIRESQESSPSVPVHALGICLPLARSWQVFVLVELVHLGGSSVSLLVEDARDQLCQGCRCSRVGDLLGRLVDGAAALEYAS